MALSLLCSSSPRTSSGRDEVYVASTPLIAPKGPAQLFLSTAHSLNLWDLQHFMVIIKPTSLPQPYQALVYDFQPKDPEDISVAIAALSGRRLSGVILSRKLTKLPKRKCWFVGYSKENAMDEAIKFNENWETDLRIGQHDCRHYSEGLVEHLTGNKAVLKQLTQQQVYNLF